MNHVMDSMREPGSGAPVAEWVDLDEMHEDPYPTYARLRGLGPVVFIPALDLHALTTHAAVMKAERRPDIFSADVPIPDEYLLGGERSMLNKDDPAHAAERGAVNPTLRPQAMEGSWRPSFARNTEHWLNHLHDVGPSDADLARDFATPLAAQNIHSLVGFPSDVTAADVARWSAEFIAGVDIPATSGEINSVLDEILPRLARYPDGSITSHLLQAGLPEGMVRANVCLTIAGGVNEPQHMMTSMVWALTSSHEQLREILVTPTLWAAAFEESARCFSPIGWLARRTTAEVEWHGTLLPKDSDVGFFIACANHDESVFANPEAFDLHRTTRGHLGFGAGPHQCAGRWASKSSIVEVALPALFARFPGMRIDESRESAWEGWDFRGLATLAVTW